MTAATRLKLMSEYGAESHLWSTGDMVLPLELGLSPALVELLQTWQRHFDEHFDHEVGWDTPAASDWYRARASELADALRPELPSGTHLDVDLWPLSNAS